MRQLATENKFICVFSIKVVVLFIRLSSFPIFLPPTGFSAAFLPVTLKNNVIFSLINCKVTQTKKKAACFFHSSSDKCFRATLLTHRRRAELNYCSSRRIWTSRIFTFTSETVYGKLRTAQAELIYMESGRVDVAKSCKHGFPYTNKMLMMMCLLPFKPETFLIFPC